MKSRKSGIAAWFGAGAIFILAPALFAGPETPAPSGTPATAAESAEAARRKAVDAQVEQYRASIPKGPVEVKVENDLVSVNADKAWRAKILNDIGQKAGFKVISGQPSTDPVTLKFERLPLEQAIRKVAGSEPYWIGYEFDPKRTAYVVKTAMIGPKSIRMAGLMSRRDRMRELREKREAKVRAREGEAPLEPPADPSPKP